jgi:hypothetical protein
MRLLHGKHDQIILVWIRGIRGDRVQPARLLSGMDFNECRTPAKRDPHSNAFAVYQIRFPRAAN